MCQKQWSIGWTFPIIFTYGSAFVGVHDIYGGVNAL